MPSPKIDRDLLRSAVRKLTKPQLLDLLDDALDLVPKARLAGLVEPHLDTEKLRPKPRKGSRGRTGLLAEVEAFGQASLRGDYYEGFNVNSKNYREKSQGTTTWIAECERLFDRCAEHSKTGDPAETRQAFEILLDLLHRIDDGSGEFVFFADEAGSWQVGVSWLTVLPGWFRCLAATAEPEEFARLVVAVVDEHEKWDRKKHLTAARRVATPEQKRALRGA